MKLLCSLFALAILCSFSLHAKADDFQMIVVDPQFSVTDITTPTFTFHFTGCDAGQAPAGYIGCFTGENLTGAPITSLNIEVPHLIGTQTAGCDALAGGLGFFSSCDPVTENDGYSITFTGGSIPEGPGLKGAFTIAEVGADPADFGTMTGTINGAIGATPEPDSLLLLTTGILSCGAYLVRRRRK
jgi:hypothetical protein